VFQAEVGIEDGVEACPNCDGGKAPLVERCLEQLMLSGECHGVTVCYPGGGTLTATGTTFCAAPALSFEDMPPLNADLYASRIMTALKEQRYEARCTDYHEGMRVDELGLALGMDYLVVRATLVALESEGQVHRHASSDPDGIWTVNDHLVSGMRPVQT
jgi:hypothetical protein